ncbi:hypothetical protein EDB84DRAFT_994773 [Lactarius hengduanensis]|nr:hypothetical protein EDB84DRAFT_994773 [Lactarius hengduanensis]
MGCMAVHAHEGGDGSGRRCPALVRDEMERKGRKTYLYKLFVSQVGTEARKTRVADRQIVGICCSPPLHHVRSCLNSQLLLQTSVCILSSSSPSPSHTMAASLSLTFLTGTRALSRCPVPPHKMATLCTRQHLTTYHSYFVCTQAPRCCSTHLQNVFSFFLFSLFLSHRGDNGRYHCRRPLRACRHLHSPVTTASTLLLTQQFTDSILLNYRSTPLSCLVIAATSTGPPAVPTHPDHVTATRLRSQQVQRWH